MTKTLADSLHLHPVQRHDASPVPFREFAEVAEVLSLDFARRAAELDQSGEAPAANVAALHEVGLLRLVIPRRSGGLGFGLQQAVKIVGRISQGEPATGLILAMHYLQHGTFSEAQYSADVLARVRQDALRGPALVNALRVEPELGTPVRGGIPATRITRVANGWRLNGRKIFSTGIPLLKWLAIWVATDEETPRIGTVLIPHPAAGISIEKSWNQLGMRATASHDVVFSNVVVREEEVSKLKSHAEAGVRDERVAAWSALLVSAVYDGIARAARLWFLQFIGERKPANLQAALSTLPRFQEITGKIETLLSVNARLLESASVAADGRQALPVIESGIVKMTVTENAIEAVELMLSATGNPGLSRSNPLERHYRDVLCGRVHTPQADSVLVQAGLAAINAVGSRSNVS